jgi:hypothetical protein
MYFTIHLNKHSSLCIIRHLQTVCETVLKDEDLCYILKEYTYYKDNSELTTPQQTEWRELDQHILQNSLP